MERNRQYNLRSAKQGSIQVPVEIQMCNNRKYLESLLNPVDEYQASQDIWKRWWNKNKAFANRCDDRTFAQVLKQSKAQKQIRSIFMCFIKIQEKNMVIRHMITRYLNKRSL